jgi:NADH:ubiquinone oxidoreductase subunit C
MVRILSSRPIIVTHDVVGFEGHPLRKDFPLTVIAALNLCEC